MLLRVLKDGSRTPTENMAVDEALLRSSGPPTLRLYGWRPHAVSLGYFQKLADFADLPPGTPIVRRSTGGGAIHHGDEVTFALAVDASALPSDIDASYVLLHDAVRAALADIGVACTRLTSGPSCGARPGVRWCFAEPGRHDLVDQQGRKLVGSAQRRIRTDRARILHHGSIVLERPALTPFVAAIADQRPLAEASPALHESLVARIASALHLEPLAGTLTDEEENSARQHQAARFGEADFLGAY